MATYIPLDPNANLGFDPNAEGANLASSSADLRYLSGELPIGAGLLPPTASSPAIVSSTQARDQVTKDVNLVNQPVASPTTTAPQLGPGGRAPEGQEYGPQGQLQPKTPAQQGITASDALLELKRDQANQALQQGDMTAFNDFVTEYKSSLAERNKYREELISSLKPSAEERTLREQLAEFRKQAQEGIEFERNRPGVVTALATGRAEARPRQSQIEEQNLIDKIGIFQTDREIAGKIAQVGLDSVLQDADSAAKIFEMRTNYEDKLLERTRIWDKDKKDALADVLENFDGVDPDKITPEMEAQISNALIPYGLSFSQVKPFLDAQWTGGELDRRVKEAGIAKTLSDAAGGGDSEGGKLLTPSEAQLLGVPYGTTRAGAAGITPKKQLGTVQTNDLIQAQIAKNNINRIAELIDDLGVQGPAIGRFRNANPYDTKVVELNNLLTQTVPGLARGIFKEVGVLTDTDIARYMTTLANTNLTKEQAKIATEQLLKTIDYSIKTQLDTFDKTGRDVRDFDDLRESVSGAAPPPITPEQATASLDSILNTGSTQAISGGSSGGWWDDFLGVFGLQTK